MDKKLLIDATYPEEIRVAVIKDGILDEFDSEIFAKKPIRGNIYLAKIHRIEPSLQAAFVHYGANRQGFLPFSEIHPSYYQIPTTDKILDEQHEDTNNEPLVNEENNFQEGEISQNAKESILEVFNNTIKQPHTHRYRLQEVIKKRQILLVQVTKEERGNKGVSLTTYLSFPGRYCVLMPNAGHRTGGISRKIYDDEARKRLRYFVKSLDVPEEMSLIVRTASQRCNKSEIKRDYEYLMHIWDETRDQTLKSMAPSLIYAEGDLVVRAIRDIYTRDIKEVLVVNEEACKTARSFMKKFIPSHVRKVKFYQDNKTTLFERFNVEKQIRECMSPAVQLPSGGSIVINSTEALTAIDVNSGKSTRERNIEETALKTNIEAVEAIVRQMRLRDIGGLTVVDFIDMETKGFADKVEKHFKDLIKDDIARIQIGKISSFGLLELSRQRLRSSIFDTHTVPCPHCQGTGLIPSIQALSLLILRDLENRILQKEGNYFIITVPHDIDNYLLNQKRTSLLTIENKYNISIHILCNPTFYKPYYRIDTFMDENDFERISANTLEEQSIKKEVVKFSSNNENQSKKDLIGIFGKHHKDENKRPPNNLKQRKQFSPYTHTHRQNKNAMNQKRSNISPIPFVEEEKNEGPEKKKSWIRRLLD
ncbi:MAG: Rne/Rng family ribonuclease [Alphaproteobacteria bacterium]